MAMQHRPGQRKPVQVGTNCTGFGMESHGEGVHKPRDARHVCKRFQTKSIYKMRVRKSSSEQQCKHVKTTTRRGIDAVNKLQAI